MIIITTDYRIKVLNSKLFLKVAKHDLEYANPMLKYLRSWVSTKVSWICNMKSWITWTLFLNFAPFEHQAILFLSSPVKNYIICTCRSVFTFVYCKKTDVQCDIKNANLSDIRFTFLLWSCCPPQHWKNNNIHNDLHKLKVYVTQTAFNSSKYWPCSIEIHIVQLHQAVWQKPKW